MGSYGTVDAYADYINKGTEKWELKVTSMVLKTKNNLRYLTLEWVLSGRIRCARLFK